MSHPVRVTGQKSVSMTCEVNVPRQRTVSQLRKVIRFDNLEHDNAQDIIACRGEVVSSLLVTAHPALPELAFRPRRLWTASTRDWCTRGRS